MRRAPQNWLHRETPHQSRRHDWLWRDFLLRRSRSRRGPHRARSRCRAVTRPSTSPKTKKPAGARCPSRRGSPRCCASTAPVCAQALALYEAGVNRREIAQPLCTTPKKISQLIWCERMARRRAVRSSTRSTPIRSIRHSPSERQRYGARWVDLARAHTATHASKSARYTGAVLESCASLKADSPPQDQLTRTVESRKKICRADTARTAKCLILLAERTAVANPCKLLKRKNQIPATPQAARQNAHT